MKMGLNWFLPFCLLAAILSSCPSPQPEEQPPSFSQEELDSIKAKEKRMLRPRRSKEQLQEAGELEGWNETALPFFENIVCMVFIFFLGLHYIVPFGHIIQKFR